MSAERRVVSISPYPPTEHGGVTTVINGSTKALERLGWHIERFAPAIDNKPNPFGITTTGRVIFYAKLWGTNFPVAWVDRRQVRKAILEKEPDIVIVDEPALAITALSQIPKRVDGKRIPATIGRYHAQLETDTHGTRAANNIFGPLVRRGTETLDGRIAVSEATAKTWVRYFPDEPFTVIPNGVDTKRFTPKGPRMEEWLQDGKKTILFVGRHDKRKGVEYLLHAFSQILQYRSDIKLKIAGQGSETENLKKLVQQLGIQENVNFLGIISDNDLEKAYRTADVSVFPSTHGEGFGIVILEALASGSLVVASDINGYQEATEYGQPFAKLTQPANAENLENVINYILNLPKEEKTRLKTQARAYVDPRYDWETIARKTYELGEANLEKHGVPSKQDWERARKQTERTIFQRAITVFDWKSHLARRK